MNPLQSFFTFLNAVKRKLWREVTFTKTVREKMRGEKYVYRFDRAQTEWRHIPVDEIGYLDSAALLSRDDAFLLGLTKKFEKKRYDLKGWRNFRNRWRELSGVDSLRGKHVLDFGCGFGIESLQFARNGNRVSLADILPSNLALAERILKLHGFSPLEVVQATNEFPFFSLRNSLDVFYSHGVLHHTPKIREILKRACELLAPGGEIRLMLYSDEAWKIATGAGLPPVSEEVTSHPSFFKYVRFFDSYGEYADWYNREKLESRFGDFLTINSVDYFTRDGRFLMTTMVPKTV